MTTVYDTVAHEKEILRGQIEDERRKTIAAEAQRNKLAMDNAQLIRQHQQDAADIEAQKFENIRLRNRCTLLEQDIIRARAGR